MDEHPLEHCVDAHGAHHTPEGNWKASAGDGLGLTAYSAHDHIGQDSPTFRNPDIHPIQLEYALTSNLSSDNEGVFEPELKRRRSGGSAINGLTNRVITRLPSLTKRKGRKRPCGTRSEDNSGASTPVNPRSRSSSRARSLSIFQGPDSPTMDIDDIDDVKMRDRIDTIEEVVDHEDSAQDLQPFHPMDQEGDQGKCKSLERVHTPLLPTISSTKSGENSPPGCLDSSALVDSVIGDGYTDSSNSIQPTPELSAKNSVGALKDTCQQNHDIHSWTKNDISMTAVTEDEWSEKLGHADFTIQPQPYSPLNFNSETCSNLLKDWQKARAEYSKHLARTQKHFGLGSRTYRLTESKWAEIDSVWKRKYDDARMKTSVNEGTPPNSPAEPAPVFKIPTLDEKFPQLQDYEIVGPMERIDPPERAATQIKHMPSKRGGFMKLFGNLNRRARATSGPR